MFVVAMLLIAPVVFSNPDVKNVTIAATWSGGVSMTFDKMALTYPEMTFPHDGTWKSPVEGVINASFSYSVLSGRHVRLAIASQAWVPVTTYGPETTIQVIGSGSIPVAATYVVPIVGAETQLWHSLSNPTGTFATTFNIQVKNANLPSNSYTTALSFIFADVE